MVELFGAKSVVYRVFDHFVEVLPRSCRVLLLVNLDFDEEDDPSGIARDASDQAFIANASESGDALFPVSEASHIQPAMHVVRRAYERVTE